MKTVKRHAIVGERILITNKDSGEFRYENGDIFTVDRDARDGDVFVESSTIICVMFREYEVITDLAELLAAGDKVELLSGGSVYPLAGFRNGETYTLTALAGEDDHDDYGHSGAGLAMISGGSTGDRIGYADPSQLRKVSAVEFKNGSRVILQAGSAAGSFPLYGFQNGGEYEVIDQIDPKKASTGHAGRLKIVKLDGIGRGYALPSQLQMKPVVQPAQPVPVPASAISPVFEMGDRVEVIDASGAAFSVGDIGKVTDIKDVAGSKQHIGIRLTDRTLRQWFFPEQLRKIPAMAQPAPAVKPAPVEFKLGDRVQSIAEVFQGEFGTVIKEDTDGTSRVMFDSGISHWKNHKNLVKIAEAAAKFKAGDKVVVTEPGLATGETFTLKERRPSCDLRGKGFAWYVEESSGWVGEDQVEAAPIAPAAAAKPEPKIGDRVHEFTGMFKGKEGIVIGIREPRFISADQGLRYKTDSGSIYWTYIKDVEVISAAPEFSPGDIVVNKRNGREYTLAERCPSADGVYGKAWNLVGRPTWLGEDQITATGKKAPITAKIDASKITTGSIITGTVTASKITAGTIKIAQSFKVGDRVKSIRGRHAGQVGVITEIEDEEGGIVKFDSGDSNFKYFRRLELIPAAQSFKVGDIITGTSGNGYGITTDKMTRGEVVEVTARGNVKVKVLEHSTMSEKIGAYYTVKPEKFVKVEDAAAFKVGDRVVGTVEALRPGVIGTIIDANYSGLGIMFKPDDSSKSLRTDGLIFDYAKDLVKISK